MRGIAVGLLLAAAGVAAGYFWGSSAASERGPLHNVPAPAAAKPAVSAPRGGGDEPDEGTVSDLSRALRDLPRPGVERGIGKITGHVRAADGTPLSNVTVEAQRNWSSSGGYWRPGDPAPKRKSLEESVRDSVKSYYAREAGCARTVTGADGAYALAGLANGRYSMHAYKKGLEIQPVGQSWQVKPDCVVDFSAHPIADVPVDVLLPDGSRPRRASISWHSDVSNGNRQEAWSSAQPSIRVRPGKCTFKAEVQEPFPLESDEVRVNVPGSGTVEQVVLRVVDHPGIRGSVRLPDGAKSSYLSIHVLAAQPGAEIDAGSLRRRGKSVFVAPGRDFWVKDIAPGHYQVGVTLGSALVAKREVDVGQATVPCDFRIEHLDPSTYVVLHVYGPDGKTPEQVRVSGGHRSDHGSHSGGTGWIRLEDGTFWVTHEALQNGETGGTDYLQVTANDYGTKEVEYHREKDRELTVRFVEPATLTVTMSGDASILSRFSVSLVPWTRSDSYSPGMPGKDLDGKGQATLGPVEPGVYAVVVHLKRDRFSGGEAARQRVELAAGENHVEIPAPHLCTLTVVADNLKPGDTLALTRAGGPGWSRQRAKVDKEGRAVFQEVPEGKYRIQGHMGEMGGVMDVEVSGDTTVSFSPKELNALAVKIVDPAGTLAQAGFRDGDLVIGMDGKVFANLREAQLRFAGSMDKESVPLLVQREGRQIVLKVSLKQLMQGGGRKQGGSLRPASR